MIIYLLNYFIPQIFIKPFLLRYFIGHEATEMDIMQYNLTALDNSL